MEFSEKDRRDPFVVFYLDTPCKEQSCPKGEHCPLAHSIAENHSHPNRKDAVGLCGVREHDKVPADKSLCNCPLRHSWESKEEVKVRHPALAARWRERWAEQLGASKAKAKAPETVKVASEPSSAAPVANNTAAASVSSNTVATEQGTSQPASNASASAEKSAAAPAAEASGSASSSVKTDGEAKKTAPPASKPSLNVGAKEFKPSWLAAPAPAVSAPKPIEQPSSSGAASSTGSVAQVTRATAGLNVSAKAFVPGGGAAVPTPTRSWAEYCAHYTQTFRTFVCRYGPQCPNPGTCSGYHTAFEGRRVPGVGDKLAYLPSMCPRADECPLSEDCPLCHTADELLYHPMIFKTTRCADPTHTESTHAVVCNQAHGSEKVVDIGVIDLTLGAAWQLQWRAAILALYRVSLCEDPQCPGAETCMFAHSVDELRTPVDPGDESYPIEPQNDCEEIYSPRHYQSLPCPEPQHVDATQFMFLEELFDFLTCPYFHES